MEGWVIVTDHGMFLTFVSKQGTDTIYIKRSKLFDSKDVAIEYKNKMPGVNKKVKVMTYFDADRFNRQLQLRFS